MRLAGKVAVITGAGSGIGRAAAFAVRSGRCGRRGGSLRARRPEPLPPTIMAAPSDVTRDEDTARLFGATVDRYGTLDILVNNAGIELPGTVTETTDEHWQRLIDVN